MGELLKGWHRRYPAGGGAGEHLQGAARLPSLVAARAPAGGSGGSCRGGRTSGRGGVGSSRGQRGLWQGRRGSGRGGGAPAEAGGTSDRAALAPARAEETFSFFILFFKLEIRGTFA
jgi:hypothetical protein